MSAQATIALIDFAMSLAERAPNIIEELFHKGDITAEERTRLQARVASSRSRVGLPPAPTSHSPGSGTLPSV